MSDIIAAGIKIGATTYVVPSDGTGTTLTSLGIKEGKTLETVFAADSDSFITRRSADFTVKNFVLSPSAPNGYTQARASSIIRFPLILENGKRTVSTLKLEYAFDPEVSSADKTDQILVGSQILGDTDFRDFWLNLKLG